MAHQTTEIAIAVSGGYDPESQKALVYVRLGNSDFDYGMAPAQAKEVAAALLQCAAAAENEAYLIEFMARRLDVPAAMQLILMAEYRSWRKQRMREEQQKRGESNPDRNASNNGV